MGLDQYAYAREVIKSDDEEEPVDIEIAYWRKHNRLHGWMENLYRTKNPNSDSVFNCENVKLTSDDLDKLEKDIIDKVLPHTQGFFFGDDSYSYSDIDEMMKYDLEFIANSKEYLKQGLEVYYTSWW